MTLEGCDCFWVDLKPWTTRAETVDPGSARVSNPDCLEHFPTRQTKEA